MPWLARLDAHAQKWPKPAYWLYAGFKWYLVLAGAFILVRMYLDRLAIWPLH